MLIVLCVEAFNLNDLLSITLCFFRLSRGVRAIAFYRITLAMAWYDVFGDLF
jgi:hypothetical protein